MGFVSASTISEIFGGGKKKDDFDLKTAIIDPKIIKKVPKSFANKYNLIPIKYSNKVVTVAMSDIFNIVALDRIKDFFLVILRLKQYISLSLI